VKHEVGVKDLATVIASLVRQQAIGGSCCVPYEDLGGNKRIALVFVAKDHLDHEELYEMFTESVISWIDCDLLAIPPGFDEWVAKHELSPN